MPVGQITPGFKITKNPQAPLPSALLAGLAKGPIAFWEPGNPTNYLPWDPNSRTAYVPASASTVPNLARVATSLAPTGLAAATLGADPGDFIITNGMNNAGAKARVERTRAGCIHVMSSQVNGDSSYETFRASMGSAAGVIPTYLNTAGNQSHSYYLGLWLRVTRLFAGQGGGSTISAAIAGIMRGSPDGNTTDRWLTGGLTATSAVGAATPPNGDSRNGGVTVTYDQATGLVFVGVTATSAPASFAAIDRFINCGASSAGFVNKYPSFIPIRGYLEDLTASGKTHADRVGIDQGEFVDACQTSGKRYFADTIAAGAVSNPATVLP